MSIKIERMVVKNQQRGSAFVMARFDVNVGPLTIKGFELVRLGESTFATPPYNLFTPQGEQKAKRFSYVFFNGDRGKKMEEAIFLAAREEYQRRGGAQTQNQGYGQQQQYGGYRGGGYNRPTESDPSGFDDDLPF